MSVDATKETKESIEQDVFAVYNAYIDSFNGGKVDDCVACFAIPYFDLRTVDGTPTQVVYTSAEESKGYFANTLEQLQAAGWKGSSRVVNTELTQLGADMVHLLVDFERLTADGEPIDAHRVIYTFIRPEGRWLIAGYVAVDAEYAN